MMVVTVAMLRYASWSVGADIVSARSSDYAIFGLTAAMAGLMTDRRILGLSVFYYGAFLIGLIWPAAQLWGSAVANLLFFLGLAWVWRRR